MAQGNLRELEILLDRKGLVYARGSSGETPFHTAVLNKQLPIIQFMLEKFPLVIQARDHVSRNSYVEICIIPIVLHYVKFQLF